MTECTDFRHELGAYVLASLDETEIRAVEAHLAGCSACRAERDDLAGLVELLDLTGEQPPPVPARVRDRVVAKAARRQGYRRWGLLAAAAAVLGAVLGGFVGWRLAPPPTLAVPLEQVEPFTASGWAAFDPRDGRVVVEVDLDGLEPLPDPAVYEAWLSTHDDRVLSIGQFDTDPDGSVTVTLEAGGALEDYRGFWITAEPDRRDPAHDGPTVVAAPVPPPR